MSDSSTITREQLRTVIVATELGGKVGESDRFSYAALGNSTYSFGQLQYDVGNNAAARNFLKENGFDAADIKDLSNHGGLTHERLDALDAKLKAIPQIKVEQFTNAQLDKTIASVGDVIDSVRKGNPAAADAIVKDSKLQLGIADYTNQFGSVGPQLIGFLSGKEETIKATGITVKAANPPTREDIQAFIDATPYGHNKANARGVEGRAEHFNEAMAELKLGPPMPAHGHHVSGEPRTVLNLGSRGEAVGALQRDLAALGYTDAKGQPLKPDKDYGHATDAAVRAFQREHGLEQNGVGPKTQQALHAELQALAQKSKDVPGAGAPALPAAGAANAVDDPRHALSPDHALYNQLKARIPEASENRLLQFTAACHANKITADNLSTIHLDEANMKIGLYGSGFLSTSALVDLKTPPPQPQQSIQQIQQYNQQQAQMTGQTQAQNALINPKAQQAPMPGGSGR